MIEIINIFFLILSMLWITSFPLIKDNFKSNLIIYNISSLERISINLSIFLNILLILSFYKISQELIFITFLLLSLLNFLYFKKKIELNNLIILFLFVFIFSISISSNLTLEWDAAELWIYKTINFLFENDFKNLSNIPGVISYPHLGTYIWAFFWKNSFFDAEYVGRIFYVFTYCLCILLIIDLKKIFLKKILLIFGFFIISLDYYLLSGYQEYLVFSILIFIFYFYLKYFEKKQIFFLIPIAFFINTIIWTKNEASFFVLFFFFFIFYHFLINKNKINKEIIFLFIFFVFAVFIKYFIFYKSFNVINAGWHNYEFHSLTKIFQVSYFIERTSAIILSIFIALIKCKVYLIFFLTILFFINKKNLKNFLPYIFFLLLNLFLIFLIYYFTNDPNWKLYLSTTVDRLLFQTSGVFLLPIFFYLKENIKLN
tara:strand:- start:479 stop:1765 length:1287 start_codon:yes stop_codon:yes gene_type:complete